MDSNRTIVLHVLPGLRAGGVERILQTIVASTSREFRHRVVSLSGLGKVGSEMVAAGNEVHWLGVQTTADTLQAFWRLRQLARDADLIHGWIYHGSVASLAVAGLRRRTPMIAAFHATDVSRLEVSRRTRIAIRLARLAARFADQVVYCSPGAERSHTAYGFKSKNAVVVPNGVDTNVFRPPSAPRAEIRRSLGLANPERKTILVPARFAPQKDYPTILRALSLLRESNEDWRAVLCGHGVGPDNQALLDMVEAAQLQEHVLIAGEVSDMPTWMQAADVMLLGSSHGEALPMVVLEAMASGVLVIATDVGDTRVVLNGTGFIAPPKNPHLLAIGLYNAMTSDPFQRQLLIEAARNQAVQNYSQLRMAEGYRSIYRSLLDKR